MIRWLPILALTALPAAVAVLGCALERWITRDETTNLY